MHANADGPFSWFCRAAEESLSAKLPALLRASWVSMPKAGSLGHSENAGSMVNFDAYSTKFGHFQIFLASLFF